jgi:hypothetical protein
MKNKSFIVIAVLAVLGIGLIAGAAIYYSKTIDGNDTPSADVSSTVTETYFTDVSSTSKPEKSAAKSTRSETVSDSEETAEDEIAEESETGTLKHGGISPEFKKFWDDYESFIGKYATALNDKTNPDYQSLNDRYNNYVKKAAEYESSEELTDEEVDYMTSAHARITAKYASAWLGETE